MTKRQSGSFKLLDAAILYDGPKQRCWAHLLRDIHDQHTLYPDAAPLARWPDAVHGIYERAKAFTHPQAKRHQPSVQQRHHEYAK